MAHVLVNDICKAKADKSSQFTDWSHRPLSQKQITYALNDVIFLKDIYQSLKQRLDKKGRGDWVLEETNDLLSPALYQFSPRDAWQRLKLRSPKARDLAVLRELAQWREEEAQKKDVPRGRILKDETLLDLTYQKPRTESELGRIRGVTPDMARGKFGKLILAAMERGLAVPDSDCALPAALRALEWPELLEAWAVDFAAEMGAMRPDERHHRPRAQRALVLESGVHRYGGDGPFTVRVLIADRLGVEHREAFTLAWVAGELRVARVS